MDQLTKIFDDHEIRIIQNGEPLFVAKDLCGALEIDNSRRATGRLDDDEKGVTTVNTPGGPQRMTVVNEPGAYRLIFTSRKPEAERMKRWLAHDVLPELRRSRSYHMGDGAPMQQDGDALEVAEHLLTDVKQERSKRTDLERHKDHTAYEVQRLEERVEQLEDGKQAPTTAQTRYGHDVQGYTWDAMRRTIGALVQEEQRRVGCAHSLIWHQLYDRVNQQFRFSPLRLKEKRNASSGLQALDFDEMRAVYAVARWLCS